MYPGKKTEVYKLDYKVINCDGETIQWIVEFEEVENEVRDIDLLDLFVSMSNENCKRSNKRSVFVTLC